jgi:endonuclease/exonuclease/phosphatase family metal-dependent hydrolase
MVKLVCYNIEYCEGMEGMWYQYLQFWKVFFPPKNLDEKIIAALKYVNPDILALVEVDTGSFRAKKDEVVVFEEGLNMKSFVEKVKYPVQGWLRLFHYVPILNRQSNAIMAKYDMSNTKTHLLSKGTKRVVIETTVHCPQKVTLLLAHLALGKKTRAIQIEELTTLVNSISTPVILMGDFNTFQGEEEIQELLQKTHLTDKVSLQKHSLGLTQPTWHPKRRLDYVLVSDTIDVMTYEVLNYPFSDHMPLLVEFNLKKNKS